MPKSIVSFVVTAHSLSRGISDNFWDTLEPAYIDAWQYANEALCRRVFHHKDIDIEVQMDLSSAIGRLKREHQITKRIKTGGEPMAFHRYPRSRVKIPVSASLSREGDSFSNHNLAQHFIEEMLYDLFLVLNIAAPGCMDLYDASIAKPKIRFMKHDFRLSNWAFESAMISGFEGKTKKLSILDVREVADWLFRVRASASQIPSNPAEKALFALLHLAKGETDHLSIVWIFYALEALFSTSPGENLRALNNRISILLHLEEKEAKSLRKHLRQLYDARSSFVHGGMEIVGISRNEVLDQTINDRFVRYMDLSDQGVSIILSCLQALIKQGRDFPKFVEKII